MATAEQGSVKMGSDLLGIDRSTISRRIIALETQLDVQLFNRLPSGYVLTSDGQSLLEHVQQLSKTIREISQLNMTKNSEAHGRVKLMVTSQLIHDSLLSCIASFAQEHPNIAIDLVPCLKSENVSMNEADIALIETSSPPDYLIGRQIFQYDEYHYMAANLSEQISLVDKMRPITLSEYSIVNEHIDLNQSEGHSITEGALLIACIRHGLGIAKLPNFIGDIDSSLVRASNYDEGETKSVWLLMHPKMRHITRVKSLYSFLSQEIVRRHPAGHGHKPDYDRA